VYNAKKSSWPHRLRVVLSWDATATCSDPSLGTCSNDVLDADLDLYVYRKSDGQLMGYSVTSANSYEFVEFDADPAAEYEIKIYAYSWTSASTYFGLAWDITSFSTN
jgi:hypothetical protein